MRCRHGRATFISPSTSTRNRNPKKLPGREDGGACLKNKQGTSSIPPFFFAGFPLPAGFLLPGAKRND